MKVPQPRKLPSGSWFIQLRLGGVSIPVTASTEKECRRQATLIKAEHQAGKRAMRKADMTLRQACESYIRKKENAGASPETIRGYDVILHNRFQSVMDIPVSTKTDWQKAYDADAKRLKPKTMQNAWRFIRTVCRSECGIELPRIETLVSDRREHTFLEPDQIKKFVAATKGDRHQIPLLLCLMSCRSSEVQGLDWKEIDLKNNRIRIVETVVRNKNGEFVRKERTKTEESTRYIPIFIPELRAALEAVPDKTGKVVKVRPNTVYRRANAICEALGLPLVGQHGLRHSFASLCYSLEVPMKITMQLGGWSNDKVVSEIYTHLDKMHIEAQISKLEQFFAGS